MPAKSEAGPGWRSTFRFSLRQLMLATAFVAVGCYALRWASPWWAVVLFYIGLLLIIAGALIAINRSGETRSFWAGFSICGIAHLLLMFSFGTNRYQTWFPGAPVTIRLSNWTYQQLKPALTVNPIPVSAEEFEESVENMPGRGSQYHSPNEQALTRVMAGEDGRFRACGPGPYYIHGKDFEEVACGLWTVLIAFLGGCISLAIYRTRPKE